MIQLALIDVIQAEREREIETAIRRRQLMQAQEDAEPVQPATRRTTQGRSLAVRARSTT